MPNFDAQFCPKEGTEVLFSILKYPARESLINVGEMIQVYPTEALVRKLGE